MSERDDVTWLSRTIREGSAQRGVQFGQPSRRGFFKSLFAAAGWGAVPVWAWPGNPQPSKKKVVVGAHPWVYAAKLPGYDPTPVSETIFSDFSFAGMEAVELMHEMLLHPDSIERLGELSHKYSLPVLGTSFEANMWDRAEHPTILETAETIIQRLSKLGGRTLGTSVGRTPKPKTREQLDAQADLVRNLISLCNSYGIVLNLHNHTYEVENNEHDLRGTLERIPDAKLGPDLNWLVRAGEDPIDFIRRYSRRIVFLHLRDQKANGKWSEALGEGNMDFVGIGRELQKINFSGDAVIELAHEQDFRLTRPLRESLKMSREFVRKTMGY
jgi:sugar phosphate isomerase/epimerase